MSLLEFRRNVYSQNGEDGVIAEILRRLGAASADDRWCVEFGAWDGKHLSNTFLLVESEGWHAVYIEADPLRFQDLELTASHHGTVTALCSKVGGEKGSGSALDDILATTACPPNYDLLSIDIDSSDLDVWARHVDYRPSVVVIEINSEIPPGVLQWHGSGVQGNSFSAAVQVGTSKGYGLVCHTGNLIFVRDDLIERIGLDELDRSFPERLFLWHWLTTPKPMKTRILTAGTRLPELVKRPLRPFFLNR